MAHGAPDWWGRSPKETTYAIEDMAELAARLGSIVTFDRRGDIIYLDDFRNGLTGWRWGAGGAGGEVYPVAYPTQRGGVAVQLTCNTGYSSVIEIAKVFPRPVAKPVGLEVAFSPEPGAGRIAPNIIWYSGSNKYSYVCRYVHSDGVLQIRHSDGNWHTIGSPGSAPEGYGYFSIMKMVVNLLTGKHVRVIFNEHVYDTSSYEPYVTSNTRPPQLEITITHGGSDSGPSVFTVDDVIYTQNEPV